MMEPFTVLAKRCLAPALRIAMAIRTFPLGAFSYDG